MKADLSASLYDTPDGWNTQPAEAAVAWLLSPDFYQRQQGVPRPLRDSSVVVYRSMLLKFIRTVVRPEEGPAKAWSEVNSADIQAFLNASRIQRGIRNRYVRLLERLFEHLSSKGIVEGLNPARGLAVKEPARTHRPNEETQWLTPAQQEAVWASMPDGVNWLDPRNRALIGVVLGGGVRVGEVVTLTTGSVGKRKADGSLELEVYPHDSGRWHRTRVAPFAAPSLTRWLTLREDYGFPGHVLFPSRRGGVMHPSAVYRLVAKVLDAAGIDPDLIKRRGARTLRNTFALRELREGASADQVGEFLGHRAERSTRYYTSIVRRTK